MDVASLSTVDWAELWSKGFRACVFDKDNTLTLPYSLEIHPDVADSLAQCLKIFQNRVVLFSNSAGLAQFDPDGIEAKLLEDALHIPVLRHEEKKPAGGVAELEQHFGVPAEAMIMVGDRYLTDVAFGNRHGMLTIRPRPFSTDDETVTVRLARKLEEACVARWRARSVAPPHHRLFQG